MEMAQRKIFAGRLGKLRNDKGLSQQQLANETGINRETIARYETYKRIPSFEHLTKFADFFQTTTDYLLGLTTADTREADVQSACNVTHLSRTAVLELQKYYSSNLNAFNNLVENHNFSNLLDALNNYAEVKHRIDNTNALNKDIKTYSQLQNYLDDEVKNMAYNILTQLEKINEPKTPEEQAELDAQILLEDSGYVVLMSDYEILDYYRQRISSLLIDILGE